MMDTPSYRSLLECDKYRAYGGLKLNIFVN